MSALTPMVDGDELVARLERCLKDTRAVGERAAGLAIEDALDDLKTRFRLHPAQILEDRAELEAERAMERRF